jgi:hypothetical protein
MSLDTSERSSTSQGRDALGRFAPTHGAYVRAPVTRRVRHLRFGYALHLGYPSWVSVPAPVKAAITAAVRLELFAAHLFSPFWAGQEVPKRFDTATENLRRALADLGIEPRRSKTGPDLAAYVKQRYGQRTAEGSASPSTRGAPPGGAERTDAASGGAR